MSDFSRAVASDALRAFQQHPVVLLEGARGAGKHALAQELSGPQSPSHTFDDAAIRALAHDDPSVLLDPKEQSLVFREVQRHPDFLAELADYIGKSKTPGRVILTTSVRAELLPMPKRLRKRLKIVTLHTPSHSELFGRGGDWLSLILRRRMPSPTPLTRQQLAHLLASRSDHPNMGLRQSLRSDWIDAQLEKIATDDAPSIGSTQPQLLRALLNACATNPTSELNSSELSRLTGASRGTVDKHLGILESLFLLQFLPGWQDGVTSRPVHRPRLYLADTRLSAGLGGYSPAELAAPTGHLRLRELMEQLVVNELSKQATVSPVEQRLHHFRDRNGLRVPLIIETPEGIVAVDVHASSRITAEVARPLHEFRDRAAGRFRVGVILYMGKAATLGDRLHALPINSLWEHSPAR